MKKSASEGVAKQPDGVEDEARRQALKRFARYAVAAPTAVLLLAPRNADAAGRYAGGSFWDWVRGLIRDLGGGGGTGGGYH